MEWRKPGVLLSYSLWLFRLVVSLNLQPGNQFSKGFAPITIRDAIPGLIKSTNEVWTICFRLQAENRAWSKQLRMETQAQVNTRLAKTISLEEYASSRLIAAQKTLPSAAAAPENPVHAKSRAAAPIRCRKS